MFMFFVICMVGERDWCMKLGGVCSCCFTPQIINSNRVFPYKPSILWYPGIPIFGNPHILATGQNDLSPKNSPAHLLRLEEAPFPSLRSVFSGAGWRRPVKTHGFHGFGLQNESTCSQRYLEKLSCVVFVIS